MDEPTPPKVWLVLAAGWQHVCLSEEAARQSAEGQAARCPGFQVALYECVPVATIAGRTVVMKWHEAAPSTRKV